MTAIAPRRRRNADNVRDPMRHAIALLAYSLQLQATVRQAASSERRQVRSSARGAHEFAIEELMRAFDADDDLAALVGRVVRCGRGRRRT
jgi:hypothetical protein